jgi:glycosyltransferase involved in cell wall biosynthesis
LKHTFAILIPAHNEESLLPRCLRSIPFSPNIGVIVVADNCTDATAKFALNMGATCVIRNDLARIGKGYALAHGLPAAFSARPDAILILDADCELAPQTLAGFDAALARGQRVVQAPLIVRIHNTGDSAYIASVGAEVDNAVLRGSHRLGGSVPLRGTGMLFRRDVLETHPWSMHGLAEDAEFSAVLRRAGVRVNLLERGAILSEAPTRSSDLLQQRRRWRAALTVPGLGWASKFVTSKPLILGHLAVTATLVLVLPVPVWMLGWLIGIVGATASVYLRAMLKVGLRWPGLGSAFLVARLAGVAITGFWKREATWQRTSRE